jgi:hypothetical protein
MVRTGRSGPDSAEVEHNMMIKGLESLRAAQDTVRTGREVVVSPSTSMEQTTVLTHDLHGEGKDPPVPLTPGVAGEGIAIVAVETNSETVDTEELWEEGSVGEKGGDRPSWEILVTREELMKETELEPRDTKRLKTLDAEMDYNIPVMTTDSGRDGKGSSTSMKSDPNMDLEQLAARHDLDCRQNRVATVPDDDTRPSLRPGSPTKSKKLRKEPALPPTRARTRSHSRYKL